MFSVPIRSIVFCLLLLFGSQSAFYSRLIASDIDTENICKTEKGVASYKNRWISIQGFIDNDLAKCFVHLKSLRIVSGLMIDSSGGTPEASLAIAESLTTDRIIIRVGRVCGSACASFILPTAYRIETNDNSVIMFHNTSTSILRMMGKIDHPASSRFTKLSQREIALYKLLNIELYFLTSPQLVMNTVCLVDSQRVDKNNFTIDYASEFQAVIIDRDILNSGGFNFVSTFADDQIKLQAAISHTDIFIDKSILKRLRFVTTDRRNRFPVNTVDKSTFFGHLSKRPRCKF